MGKPLVTAYRGKGTHSTSQLSDLAVFQRDVHLAGWFKSFAFRERTEKDIVGSVSKVYVVHKLTVRSRGMERSSGGSLVLLSRWCSQVVQAMESRYQDAKMFRIR